MSRTIAIIQGHPDAAGNHLGHALAQAYAQGAADAGHDVRTLTVAKLDFPLLRTMDEWNNGAPVESIRYAQEAIAKADHLLIIYPLWLGSMPAILKAFFEQVFRPGFAMSKAGSGKAWKKLLSGKSARIVVTMGMPGFVYRWYFRSHSVKSLKRNILGFCGIGPVRQSIIGMVENPDSARREQWLVQMRALGGAAR